MFDQEYRIGHKEKGLIVSVTCPTLKTHETPEKTQTSIEEMQDLMMTLGIEYSEHFTQNRAHLGSRNYYRARKTGRNCSFRERE